MDFIFLKPNSDIRKILLFQNEICNFSFEQKSIFWELKPVKQQFFFKTKVLLCCLTPGREKPDVVVLALMQQLE